VVLVAEAEGAVDLLAGDARTIRAG
jgi:hypothetical protein